MLLRQVILIDRCTGHAARVTQWRETSHSGTRLHTGQARRHGQSSIPTTVDFRGGREYPQRFGRLGVGSVFRQKRRVEAGLFQRGLELRRRIEFGRWFTFQRWIDLRRQLELWQRLELQRRFGLRQWFELGILWKNGAATVSE
jgi:hypothetical protein